VQPTKEAGRAKQGTAAKTAISAAAET